jgi:hypothetical protein
MPTLDIFALGDADMMAGALNAVAAFFQDDSFTGMLKVAIILGVILTGFKSFSGDSTWQMGNQLTQGPTFGPWSLIVPVMFGYMALTPKVDVVVNNIYNGQITPVNNVPLIIGFPMSVVSTIGQRVATAFETTFTAIPEARMVQNGFIDSIDTLNKLKLVSLNNLRPPTQTNVDIDRSVQNYYIDCVKTEINSVYPAPVTNGASIANAPDLWASLSIGNFANIDTTIFIDNGQPSGEQVSCEEAYTRLTAYLSSSAFTDNVSAMLKAGIFKKKADDPTVTGIDIATNGLNPVGLSAIDAGLLISNRIIANSLSDAESKYAASMGVHALGWSLDVNNAKFQNGATWKMQKDLFMSIAKPLMAFLEVIAIASAPLIPFMLLAGSMKVIMGWITTMVWVSMWPPIMSIVNFYIITRANAEFNEMIGALTASGLTAAQVADYFMSIKGMNIIDNISNDWFATANMLAASTPAIAMAILGGGTAMANLMKAPSGKPESVTGGITSQAGTGPGARINTATGEVLSNPGGFVDKHLAQTLGSTSLAQERATMRAFEQAHADKLQNSATTEQMAAFKQATSKTNTKTAFSEQGSEALNSKNKEFRETAQALYEKARKMDFTDKEAKELVGRAVEGVRAYGGVNTPFGGATVEGGYELSSGRKLTAEEVSSLSDMTKKGFSSANSVAEINSNSAYSRTGSRVQDEIRTGTEDSNSKGWKETNSQIVEASRRIAKTDQDSSKINWSQNLRDDMLSRKVGQHQGASSGIAAAASKYSNEVKKAYGQYGAILDPNERLKAAQIATLKNHSHHDPEARDALMAAYEAVSPVGLRVDSPHQQFNQGAHDKEMAEGDKVKQDVGNKLHGGGASGSPQASSEKATAGQESAPAGGQTGSAPATATPKQAGKVAGGSVKVAPTSTSTPSNGNGKDHQPTAKEAPPEPTAPTKTMASPSMPTLPNEAVQQLQAESAREKDERRGGVANSMANYGQKLNPIEIVGETHQMAKDSASHVVQWAKDNPGKATLMVASAAASLIGGGIAGAAGKKILGKIGTKIAESPSGQAVTGQAVKAFEATMKKLGLKVGKKEMEAFEAAAAKGGASAKADVQRAYGKDGVSQFENIEKMVKDWRDNKSGH